MRKKKQRQPEGGPKVPGYIVTFSDMVTLLLTFFVMLLSLATTQDPELFNSGRDSFVRSIRGYGLGLLFGKDRSIDFGNVKNRHEIENPEDAPNKRTLDAREERIRRVFDQLARSMVTLPSQITAEQTQFTATDVRFDDGTATLDQSARDSLKELCHNLRRAPEADEIKLYVLGLANEGTTDQGRWTLSARRAKAVADFITEICPAESRWPVYSWGAGPGGLWTGAQSAITQDCQILVAVLR